MSTKKTRTKRNTKKTSFKEFQAWLEGVKDMQGDDWTPSAEQWKRIQDKIAAVEVKLDFADEPAPRPALAMPTGPQPRAPQTTIHFPPAPGSIPDDIEIVPSSVSENTPIPTAPINAPVAVDPKVPVKTPDVDSSNGNYKSAFS